MVAVVIGGLFLGLAAPGAEAHGWGLGAAIVGLATFAVFAPIVVASTVIAHTVPPVYAPPAAYAPPPAIAPKVPPAGVPGLPGGTAAYARSGSAAQPSSVAVYFPTGQFTLDTGAQRTLRIASAAYVGIGTEIVVTGYADKKGNAAANLELARKRAAAVRDELTKLGVEARRIQLAPPVNVTGSGSDDQARRVDIVVRG